MRLPSLVIEPKRSILSELRQPGVRPRKFARLRPRGNRSMGMIRQVIARAMYNRHKRACKTLRFKLPAG